LHQRIALRFEQMLHLGLIEEMRRLRARGDLTPDLPSVRCVGYRQAWQMLDETRGREVSAPDLQRLRDTGIAATRQLAKRQLTWLRSMPERHIVACDQPDRVEQVVQLAMQVWGPPPGG
jgi:tRNA dimethylallyltransferase